MRKLIGLFALLTFVGLQICFAQAKEITGTVIDKSDKSPLPGVSVVVKSNPTQGVATDINGKFSLKVNDNDILVFTFIGMKTQEVAVKGKTNLTVELEPDSETLDEVMVVAYGTAKKSSFTGSASVMKEEELAKRQVSNVANAIAGQVAGVQATSNNGQPGVASKIRIRGVGSMAASNEPLYVVDGVPYDGDVAAINPADIESMTVLKDAASNALYGARGANGVVLITTKRGKTKEAVITLDAKWGSNKRGVEAYDVLTNPGTYYEKVYEALYNSRFNNGADAATARQHALTNLLNAKEGGAGYQVYTLPNGEALIGENGKLNPNAKLGYSDGEYYYTPDDWYHELFEKESNLRQEYNLSISGASDRMNYYLSAGYLDDSGIIPGSGYTRYSVRLKGDYQAKEWLQVGANLSYTSADSKYPAGQDAGSSSSSANLFFLTSEIAPIYPLYVRNPDGSIKIDSHGYTVYDFGDGKSSNFARPFMSQSNPASMLQLDKRNYMMDIMSAKLFGKVDLYKGLQFTANVGVDVDNTRYKRLYNAYYGQYASTGGIVYIGHQRSFSVNQQYLLTYNTTFSDVHHLDVLAGFENYNYKFQYLNGKKEKLYNPNIDEIDNAILNPSINSYTDKYATEGFLARIQYDYNSKYFLSASYRRDASSRFHSDNRWGNFWSVGAAWSMNRENFLSDQKWIDFLKFKVSYGVQGNDNLLYNESVPRTNYYPYQDQYTVAESNGDFSTTLSYKGNKDITWETSHSFNTGFDFSFFTSRLGGSVEYFFRKTTDMLYYMPVTPTLGYSEFPMNVGSVRNSGVEVDLYGEIIRTDKLSWRVNLNATHYKNKILELDKSLNGELISSSRIYREGESMYQMYLREYAGVDGETGEAMWYVTDENTGEKTTTKNWSSATRKATGDLLPKVYGGFGTTLDFYGFDFSMGFAYQLGGKIYDNTYAALMHGGDSGNGGRNWHKDILKSWSAENPNSNIPRVNSTDQNVNSLSDRFLISSNYLSIQNIVVGYSLPKSLVNKIHMSSFRVYFAADNVALFAKRKGLDPRQSFTATGGYTYSPIRSLSGGISITF